MLLDLSYAQAFPLVRGGGLFLLVVGLGIIIGGVAPRFRRATLAGSALVAALLTAFLARQLAAPFGTPSASQVSSLIGAVLLEMALIPFAVHRLHHCGTRVVTLAILMIVGLHFLPMALAFGPVVLLLAFLVCSITVVGLLIPRVPMATIWLLDGCAKLGVGSLMWLTGR